VLSDLARERGRGPAALDAVLLLDGPDAESEERARAHGIEALLKAPAGPSKGAALAFADRALGAERIGAADFVLVLDADTRLPEGFLARLAPPRGTEVFQLPVAPSEAPAAGPARVEALSFAIATRVEDRVRDALGLPVRLRGKAMGFSPAAWRAGPARGARTLVEDSEATLALLAAGFRIRALDEPAALEAPATDPGALARPRARWLAGHARLLATGAGDLVRLARRSPRGAAILAADLFLRPRALVLAFLAASAAAALALLLRGAALAALPLGLASCGLLAEALYVRRARRLLGDGAPPPVRARDLASALIVWARAVALSLVSPRRWHRARPEIAGG
jgi:cellulose synthase/poly-beta-1,6-N-acetylglucosamine synthase-like glycosyltransferase